MVLEPSWLVFLRLWWMKRLIMSDDRLPLESDGEVSFMVMVGWRKEEEDFKVRCTTKNYLGI